MYGDNWERDGSIGLRLCADIGISVPERNADVFLSAQSLDRTLHPSRSLNVGDRAKVHAGIQAA